MRFWSGFLVLLVCSLAPLAAEEPQGAESPLPSLIRTEAIIDEAAIPLPLAEVAALPIALPAALHTAATPASLVLPAPALPPAKPKAKDIAVVATAKVAQPADKPVAKVAEKSAVKPAAKPAAKPAPKAEAKAEAKAVAKQEPKPVAKPAAKPAQSENASLEKPVSKPVDSTVRLASSTASDSPAVSATTSDSLTNAAVGQVLSISLPGLGWIYLGTGKSGDGVVYLQSALEASATRFNLRLDDAGDKVLQFQRQDGQRGTMERREVRLSVAAERNRGTIQVNLEKTATNNATATPVAAAVKSSPVPTTPEEIFAMAQAREAAGKSAEALALYNRIMEIAPGYKNLDEVWYRKAAILETRLDKTRIKEAFELYQRLAAEYPYSSRAEAARSRARYLDRNYINVR